MNQSPNPISLKFVSSLTDVDERDTLSIICRHNKDLYFGRPLN
jgi:hypothetical protein